MSRRLTAIADTTSRVVDPDDRALLLSEAVRLLEEEREIVRIRRIRNLLIVGVCMSIIAHFVLMIYLNALEGGGGPAGNGVEPATLEVAVIANPEMTELSRLDRLDSFASEELAPEVPSDAPDLSPDDPAGSLGSDVSAVSLDVSPSGSVPSLGGSGIGTGEGNGSGLGGGGAGTTFFGVGSRGTRFAYIVDVSGSMGQGNKLETCMRELARSVQDLPDYASFFVVLYSSGPRPFHTEWAKARANSVSTLVRWLNSIDPSGGTQPMPAFEMVMELKDRPDVIFFLTDGLIPRETPERVGELNRRGRRVTINTIAFGDTEGQEMLKMIAQISGGVFRYVPN